MSADNRLYDTHAAILVDRQHLKALLPQFVNKPRYPHIGPRPFPPGRQIPDCVVEHHDAKGPDMRHEQFPIPLDALVGVISVNHQQVDGISPIPCRVAGQLANDLDARGDRNAAQTGILRALQSGTVSLLLGVALFVLARGKVYQEGLWIVATICAALGIGLLLASTLSYLLSKRMGLLDRTSHVSQKPDVS